VADQEAKQDGSADQINASIGENGRSIAVGKDIRQAEATGNIVNVNLPTWNPSTAHGQDELSLSAEQRLSDDIRELRATISGLAQTVGSLDKTLSVEVKSANDRIDSMQSLFEQLLRERDEPRPLFDRRTSNMLIVIGILILFLLGIIAWNSLVRNDAVLSSAYATLFLMGGMV
jgi:hypothetical protein